MGVEHVDGDLLERGLDGGDLGEDVDAVGVLLDHALEAAHLALDAAEAVVDGFGVGLHDRRSIPRGGNSHPLHFSAVSHRQDEKQRRREEREAQEKAEKARAARRQRLQIAIGGVVALAAIAVVVLLASGHARRRAAGRRGGRHARGRVQRDDPRAGHRRRRRGRQGGRLQARAPGDRGRHARGARLHGGGLQDQPADLRQPLPDVGGGRRVRARQHAAARPARPHARARPDRRPVQARHAERDGRPAQRAAGGA